MVVASVPFLANIAQSACRTVCHQQLGQVHHDRAGPVLAVAERGLRRRGRLHGRMLVAEHDRAVAAHQVDVLVPVHVPDPRPAAAAHELRVGGRQGRGRLVPVHAARDHGPRALAQIPVSVSRVHVMRSLIRPATAGWARARKSSTWPKSLDPGVGAQAGGDQRAAGDAEPGRVAGCRAEQQPGEQAGGEAVAAAGGVHHVDRDRGQGHRRAAVRASRPGSRPRPASRPRRRCPAPGRR